MIEIGVAVIGSAVLIVLAWQQRIRHRRRVEMMRAAFRRLKEES